MDIARWMSEMSGSDVAAILVIVGSVLTGLFSFLSARTARDQSGVSAALKALRATERTNERSAKNVDKLTDVLGNHLVDIKAQVTAASAKMDSLPARLGRRRR